MSGQESHLSAIRSPLPFSRPFISEKTCRRREKCEPERDEGEKKDTHDAGILALAVDAVDLGREACRRDGRVEDVVDVDGEDAQETLLARRRDRVGRVGRPAGGDVWIRLFVDKGVSGRETHAVQAFVPSAKLRLRQDECEQE